MKKYKIGIFGSAAGDLSQTLEKAKQLGESLAAHNAIIITGALTGVPYQVALAASEKGAEIWEYSPTLDSESQKAEFPDVDLSIYKKIIHVPTDLEISQHPRGRSKYRNVISTFNCDAGIIISGQWGTLGEFGNLFDFGKVIGVLKGAGGISDELESLIQKINKPGKAKVIFDSDPQNLVKKVLEELVSIS